MTKYPEDHLKEFIISISKARLFLEEGDVCLMFPPRG